MRALLPSEIHPRQGHAASILAGECILCGNCTIVCPQHAKEDINDVPMIKVLMSKHETVIAIVAPSFAAYFNISFETMKSTLEKARGFADVFEVAEGAHVVKNEYERLVAEILTRPGSPPAAPASIITSSVTAPKQRNICCLCSPQ